jgi:Major Facilitator Superfamily
MHVRLKPGSLWRHGDFLKLWTGQTISLVGSQITLLALPLTAVLTLRASALQMGLLRAVQYAPAVLLGLFAGVWVDRVRRRPILMAADLGRTALLGSVPLAALLGMLSMGYLYGVAFAVGALTVVFEVAYFAYLPALVGREQLVAANGRLQASESVASIAGPGLGGLLVQVLTAPLAIAGDACSFLVSVLSLGLIRAREPAPAPARDRNVRREIAEGLGTVLQHPLLRATLLSSGITNFFAAIFNSLTVLYATRQLGISPAGIGGIWVVGSVGGLAGAVVVGWVTARVGLGPTILLAELLIGAGSLAWPLVAGPVSLAIPVLTLGMLVISAGDSFYNINVVSLRQAVVPHGLMGRVNASLRFVIWGAQPLGALLGGVLGETIGLRGALGVAAGGFLFAFACLLFTPIRRLREAPAAGEPEGASAP